MGLWWSRSRSDPTPEPAPAPTRGGLDVDPSAAVPPGAAAVLGVLRASAVLVGPDDRVVQASASAHAARAGARTTGWSSGSCCSWSRTCAATGRSGRASWCSAGPAVGAAAPGRPGRAAGAATGAGAGRGPHPRAAGRRRPPRLRRQRQPRAQDAGRRAVAAGRGGAARPPTTRRRCAGSPPGCRSRAERLGRLVQQLIELSRLQDDELMDEPERVDVDDRRGRRARPEPHRRRGARHHARRGRPTPASAVRGNAGQLAGRARQPGRERRRLQRPTAPGSRSTVKPARRRRRRSR